MEAIIQWYQPIKRKLLYSQTNRVNIIEEKILTIREWIVTQFPKIIVLRI